MAKWCGKIGFAQTTQTTPGVYKEEIVTRTYRGDLNRNNRRLQSTDQLNDNINIANEISVVADPYANQHFHSIRYIELRGIKWKVSSVEVQYPRLILSVGGLYNG